MTSAHSLKQRWLGAGIFLAILLLAGSAWSQTQIAGSDSSDIRSIVLQLQSELKQTRQDLAHAQKEIQLLNQQMAALRPNSSVSSAEQGSSMDSPYAAPADVAEPNAIPQSGSSEQPQPDDVSLLRAKVEEQQQTKVESASKYRVKLSGMILMNAFSTRGTVDLPDLPNRA